MAIKVGDALLKFGIDKTDYDKGLQDIKKNTEETVQKMATGFRTVGAVFTAVGAAGLVVISSAKGINAQLAATGVVLGKTSDEMRDLVLSTTDVTFSVKEVANVFDLLSRAGVRNIAVMQDNAKAFDALADVAGLGADVVTDMLLPAYKALGVTLPTTAEGFDSLTWLIKNTTVNLDDFAGAMSWVAREGSSLNLSIDDMVAILAVLESRGISGTVAIRTLRSAVTEAAEKHRSLNGVLKITQEEMAGVQSKLESATGSTQKYSTIAEGQYTIMDSLRQKWDEISLVLGTWLQAAQPVFAALTALGPVIMFLTTTIGKNIVAWVAATTVSIAHAVAVGAVTVATRIATAAQWLWNTAMAANPIGAVILAVVALGSAIYGLVQAFQSWFSAGTALDSQMNFITRDIEGSSRALGDLNTEYQNAQANSFGYKAELSSLNLALNSSKDALADAKESLVAIQGEFDAATAVVADFERQIADTQNALQNLSTPNLVGMQLYKNQIFELEQAIKKLHLAELTTGVDNTAQIEALQAQLEILRLEQSITFDPLINEAQEATDTILGLNEEMTFEEVMAQIAELGAQLAPDGALGSGYATALANQTLQNAALLVQQGIVDTLTTQVADEETNIKNINDLIAIQNDNWLQVIDKGEKYIQQLRDELALLQQIESTGGPTLTTGGGTAPVVPPMPSVRGALITEPTLLTRIGETMPYRTMAETAPELISPIGAGFDFDALKSAILSAIENGLAGQTTLVQVGGEDVAAVVFRKGFDIRQRRI